MFFFKYFQDRKLRASASTNLILRKQQQKHTHTQV